MDPFHHAESLRAQTFRIVDPFRIVELFPCGQSCGQAVHNLVRLT